MKNAHTDQQQKDLTTCLCRALIIKKKVSPERFITEGMPSCPVQCPDCCHECCKNPLTLDLTSTEALLVYLLNREIAELVIEFIETRGEGQYCPFMMKDGCVIHFFKPTACQMFMPVEYKGKPICHYTLSDKSPAPLAFETYMNSYAYDIHGYMMLMQHHIGGLLSSPPFFQNIYQGVVWWKNHFQDLPKQTRRALESVLIERFQQETLTGFSIDKALGEGLEHYTLLQNQHTARDKNGTL